MDPRRHRRAHRHPLIDDHDLCRIPRQRAGAHWRSAAASANEDDKVSFFRVFARGSSTSNLGQQREQMLLGVNGEVRRVRRPMGGDVGGAEPGDLHGFGSGGNGGSNRVRASRTLSEMATSSASRDIFSPWAKVSIQGIGLRT